jgi:hypothetical protein
MKGQRVYCVGWVFIHFVSTSSPHRKIIVQTSVDNIKQFPTLMKNQYFILHTLRHQRLIIAFVREKNSANLRIIM